MKTLVITTAILVSTTSSSADIYQWYDGDGDGSLWLSDSLSEPYADLSTQTLWWANLPLANLHHAALMFTNFSFADLGGANLSLADLSYANLSEANLENTDFAYTSFFGANLDSSNIQDANMFHADFSDADLSNLENWESAFWLAARYNDNTIFPVGMDPNNFAMIEVEVPAPGTFLLIGAACFRSRRRT